MDEQQRRLDLPLDTIDLVDALLTRLKLGGESGRVEIEFQNGRCLKVFRVSKDNRSELVRYDPA